MTGYEHHAGRRCVGLAWNTPLACVAAVIGTATTAMGQLPTGGHTDCATFLFADGVPVLTIDQHVSDCVIDWDTFNIGAGNTVSFLQQSSSWRVLNRVSGAEFSTITGSLTAPGTVYIVNPAGIYFTGGAVVDVGGIYAAAGSMSDTDFMAGVDRFTGLQGEVVNEGSLFGEVVHMIGRRVINDGTIAVNGAVTMIAGENEILISETGGRILVRVDGTDLAHDLAVSPPGTVPPTLTGPAGVDNSGTINASGGQVVLGAGDLYSLAIRNTGAINATGGSAQLAALGGTVIHGGPGNTITADNLAMTGDVLFVDGDIHVQTARFNDPVIVGSNVTILPDTGDTGADSIVFASTVDSQAGEINNLWVESANTEFSGDVGSATRLGHVQITGDAVLGGDVQTAANLTFRGQVALNGATGQTIDTGGILRASGTVSKTGGGDLTLKAVTRIDLEDNVSVTSATGRLTLTSPLIEVVGDVSSANERVVFNGVADVGAVSAALDARFNGDATVGGDVTAGRDTLFFGLATVGGSVSAGDDVQFVAAAVVGENVEALGDDVRFLGTADVGGSVTAFDDVEFFADAVVGSDVTALGLDPTGGNVTFFATADIGGTVTAADDVEFLGTAVVHGDVIAQNDDVTFSGTAEVHGSVTAFDDVEFLGTAVVHGDVIAEHDDVTFFGSAEVHGSVTADDDVDFRQAAFVQGNVTASRDDVLFRAGADVGGNIHARDKAQFDGDAMVGGDVTTFEGDVLFMAGADVGGSVVAGDDAKFTAAASVAGDVTALGDDVQFFSTAQVGGSVTAFDDVQFLADAVVGRDVTAQGLEDSDNSKGNVTFSGTADVGGTVTAADDVTFLGAADLAGDVIAGADLSFGGVTTLTGLTAGAGSDQRLEAGGVLTVAGSLTKTTNGRLTLIGRELMNLNGPLVSAIDDIELNPDGRGTVPDRATIAAAGSVSIVSQAGSIVMGPNEKMTALGDLHLEAARSVTVGDLNSVGDMHVTAAEIFLRTRAPGQVLNFGGVLEPDKGLDFVTASRFFFSVAPQAIGGGPAPAFGSPNTDADALGTLGGFRFTLQLDLGPSVFTRGETILDLQASGFSPVNLAEALAGRQPGPGNRRAEEDVVLSPGQAARLTALGINVRPLRAGEKRSVLSGRYFYNDAFATSGRTLADGRVAINRLSLSAMTTAISRFDQLFLGVHDPDVRSVLASAWDNYAAATDEPDGTGFRRYVESAANHAEALGYLDTLREILDLIGISGLSATELAASTQVILDRAMSPAIPRAHLLQAIE